MGFSIITDNIPSTTLLDMLFCSPFLWSQWTSEALELGWQLFSQKVLPSSKALWFFSLAIRVTPLGSMALRKRFSLCDLESRISLWHQEDTSMEGNIIKSNIPFQTNCEESQINYPKRWVMKLPYVVLLQEIKKKAKQPLPGSNVAFVNTEIYMSMASIVWMQWALLKFCRVFKIGYL